MENNNSIKSIVTHKVSLSPNNCFALFVTLGGASYGKKYILDLRLGYKNQFISKSYEQTKYLLDGMSIFAEKDNANIFSDEFEIVQSSENKNKVATRSLLCKFLRTDIADKEIYLDRVMCRTISSIGNEVQQIFSKVKLFENPIHKEIHPQMLKFKTDDVNILKNSYDHLSRIYTDDVPLEIQKALKKYLGIEEEEEDD